MIWRWLATNQLPLCDTFSALHIHLHICSPCPCSLSCPGRDACSRCLRLTKRLWDVTKTHLRPRMHSGQRMRRWSPVCQTAAVRAASPLSGMLTHLPLLDTHGTTSIELLQVRQLNCNFFSFVIYFELLAVQFDGINLGFIVHTDTFSPVHYRSRGSRSKKWHHTEKSDINPSLYQLNNTLRCFLFHLSATEF